MAYKRLEYTNGRSNLKAGALGYSVSTVTVIRWWLMFESSAVERSDLLVRVEGHESVRACVPVASEHPCWNSATGCDDLPDLVDRSHSVAAWFKLGPASNPIVVVCDRKHRSLYASPIIRSYL